MKKPAFLLIILLFSFTASLARKHKIKSPDKNLEVIIEIKNDIRFTATYKEELVIQSATIEMKLLDGFILGPGSITRGKKRDKASKIVFPAVPTKTARLEESYNSISLIFRQPFILEFRVYNNGFAYRIKGETNQTVTVEKEVGIYTFPERSIVWFPQEEKLYSHFERVYQDTTLADIKEGAFCSLPMLLKTPQDVYVTICDSDVRDYPQMFLEKSGQNTLQAIFPKAVLETEPTPRPHSEKITKEASWIAKTRGFRTYPWRAFLIDESPEKIVENDLVYALAEDSRISDPSWIMPGKVAWDWWNANNIYGVDFRAGINTETYKYYIDFASGFGLEYIILDEGWSESGDVFAINPDIDLQEIIKYGKEKNVGIILWVLWKPLDVVMDQFLDSCQHWGVQGLKIDFMQRADQDMVNYYWKVAEKAAEHQLILDFHGAYKPAGFNRTWPNVLTHEGVKGLENNKWSRLITPEHDLTLPFTRMVGGPMDYTPGAMVNAQENNFHISFNRPMSQGTRCHEIAKYVVFESPLQMLADSPSNYYREKETTEFISRIPVTWDDIKVMEASVGEYIVLARKKGDTWYLAAMTNWKPRKFNIKLDFLENGEHTIEIMQDGINAERNAMDYKKIIRKASKSDILEINMAGGGGFVAIMGL